MAIPFLARQIIVGVCIHKPNDAARVSNHNRVGRNGSVDHRSSANHTVFSQFNARQYRRISPNRNPFLHQGFRKLDRPNLTPRERIIRKCNIRSDENLIFKAYPVPELYATFDGAIISNDDIVLYEYPIADIAILPDLGPRKNMRECPYPCSIPDMTRFANRFFMRKIGHGCFCFSQAVVVLSDFVSSRDFDNVRYD